MTDRWRPPPLRPQTLAAYILAVSNLAVFLTSPSGFGAMAVLFALVLAWLLILGSRVGWTLAFLGCVAGLLAPVSHSPAFLGAAALTIGCLLAPSSIEYTWKGSLGAASPRAGMPLGLKMLAERAAGFGCRLVAEAAGWTNDDAEERSYNLLAWRLGVLAVFLTFPLVFVYRWDQGTHSSFPHELGKVTWLLWVSVVVTLILALVLVARQHALTRHRRGGK
jgi:hypothetical protein